MYPIKSRTLAGISFYSIPLNRCRIRIEDKQCFQLTMIKIMSFGVYNNYQLLFDGRRRSHQIAKRITRKPQQHLPLWSRNPEAKPSCKVLHCLPSLLRQSIIRWYNHLHSEYKVRIHLEFSNDYPKKPLALEVEALIGITSENVAAL